MKSFHREVYFALMLCIIGLIIPHAWSAPPLEIGAASQIINPKVGDWVQGAGVPKRATKIRDDLEANALYLSNGTTQLILVSCDLGGTPPDWTKRAREAMGEATGVPDRNIIIIATHTHGGPSVIRSNYLMPIDTDYLDKLEVWMVNVAKRAVDSAQPGKLAWGKGEAQIGYNRRVCWADRTHSMYGDITRPDFVGFEGPDNPQHLALFAQDMQGELISILHHNTSHPATMYAAGVFSAEYPGVARTHLRNELGEMPVLFLNGALGDIAIPNLKNRIKESKDEQVERIARIVADETLRLYKQVKYEDSMILEHSFEDLKVNIRLAKPERVKKSRETLAKIDAGENIRGMDMVMAFGAVELQDTFGDQPTDILPIHAIRIGNVGLITQPCELYQQFAQDIEARSPAPITAVVGIADGYCGYCPTAYGVLGGGYSATPLSWTRLETLAGYKLVESANMQLHAIWNKK